MIRVSNCFKEYFGAYDESRKWILMLKLRMLEVVEGAEEKVGGNKNNGWKRLNRIVILQVSLVCYRSLVYVGWVKSFKVNNLDRQDVCIRVQERVREIEEKEVEPKKGKGRKERATRIEVEAEAVTGKGVGKDSGTYIMIITETQYGRRRLIVTDMFTK